MTDANPVDRRTAARPPDRNRMCAFRSVQVARALFNVKVARVGSQLAPGQHSIQTILRFRVKFPCRISLRHPTYFSNIYTFLRTRNIPHVNRCSDNFQTARSPRNSSRLPGNNVNMLKLSEAGDITRYEILPNLFHFTLISISYIFAIR